MRSVWLLFLFTAIAGIASVDSSEFVPISDAQTVGGDYGREWLNTFFIYNDKPVTSDPVNDLWNWGGVPKGKLLEGGKLIDDLRYINRTNITGDWLGERPLGAPVQLNLSRYAGLADGLPLSPLYLSDDPWVRAQQLGTVVRTPPGDYPDPTVA